MAPSWLQPNLLSFYFTRRLSNFYQGTQWGIVAVWLTRTATQNLPCVLNLHPLHCQEHSFDAGSLFGRNTFLCFSLNRNSISINTLFGPLVPCFKCTIWTMKKMTDVGMAICHHTAVFCLIWWPFFITKRNHRLGQTPTATETNEKQHQKKNTGSFSDKISVCQKQYLHLKPFQQESSTSQPFQQHVWTHAFTLMAARNVKDCIGIHVLTE